MCVQMQAHACGGWKWQWASYLTALPFLNISWHLLIVCVHLFVSNLSLSLTLSHCRPVCVYVCVHMHTCYDLPPLEVRGQLQGVISPSPNYILEIKLSLSVLVTNAFLQCTYYWSTTLFFFLWSLAESSCLCLPSDGIAGGYQSCLFSMWVLWIWTPDFTSVWHVLYLQSQLLSYKFANLQFLFLLWWRVQSTSQEKLYDTQTVRSAL